MKRIYLVLTMLFLLAGCAGNPGKGSYFEKLDEATLNKALIYFFQPEKDGLATGCLMITVDEIDNECMGNPGYAKIHISPGIHVFSFRRVALVDTHISTMHFDYEVEDTDTHFIKFLNYPETADSGELLFKLDLPFTRSSAGFIEVDEDTALTEMQGLRLWQ